MGRDGNGIMLASQGDHGQWQPQPVGDRRRPGEQAGSAETGGD